MWLHLYVEQTRAKRCGATRTGLEGGTPRKVVARCKLEREAKDGEVVRYAMCEITITRRLSLTPSDSALSHTHVQENVFEFKGARRNASAAI